MPADDSNLPDGETGEGPRCPECRGALSLMVEPGALQFYCPDDHHVYDVEDILAKEADRARRALQEALARWKARLQEIAGKAADARLSHQARLTEMYERRSIAASERVSIIQRSLSRLA